MRQSLIASRYKLLEEIGRGSFATVYRAVDLTEDRFVALKCLPYRGGLERLLRVQQEAAVLRRLSHPQVVKILDVGQEADTVYLATEFITGVPLSAHIARTGPLPASLAVGFLIQITQALVHVHGQGVIHRDLKPTNIMLTGDETLHLVDFGLAWIVSLAEQLSSPTVTGTFSYMAPEQTGVLDIPIDFRADLYAVGVIFYELLTGARPFVSSEAAVLIHQHVAKLPAPPRSIKADIPPILEEIVLKLLRKAPQERYQTASGLLTDLQEYQREVERGEKDIRFPIAASEMAKRPISFHTKLVGRSAEFTEIQESFRQAARGHGNALLLAGGPGVGKSRLINETRTFVNSLGGIFVSGKCTEYSPLFPYSPFIEAVEEYVQRASNFPSDKRKAVIARIRHIIGDLGEEITRIIPSIKGLIGDVCPLTSHTLEPDKHVERFLSVASDFLVGLGSDITPMLIFWDDLHWVDGGSLQLLERTLAKLKTSHVLFVGAYRDTQVDAQHPLAAFISIWKQNLTEQKLSGLSMRDVETLVQELAYLPGQQGRDLARVIFERTEGNPFFVLETMKSMLEGSGLVLREGGWTVDSHKMTHLSMSSEVDEVILQRVARLSKSAEELMSHAAVIGRHFTFEGLLGLTQRNPQSVLADIDEAIRHHIVSPRMDAAGSRGYTFCHDNILESLYKRIPKGPRQALHQRIGKDLEDLYRGRLGDVSFELALHFSRGNDPLKALQYCLMAGDLAQRTYANAEAAQFYETALSLLSQGFVPSGHDQEQLSLTVREKLGDAYALLGRYADAKMEYDRVRPHVQENHLSVTRLETKMGTVCFKQGDAEETLRHFGAGLLALGIRQPRTTPGILASLLRETGRQTLHSLWAKLFVVYGPGPYDPKAVEALRLFELLIYYYYFIDMKRCFQIHMKQLNLAEQIGSEEHCRVAYGLHALLCNAAGLHTRAMRYAEKSLDLQQTTQARQSASGVGSLAVGDSPLLNLGRACYYRAEYDRAIDFLRQAVDETMKVGNLWEAEVAHGHLCMAYFGKGQFGKVLEHACELHRIAQGVKDVRGLGWGQVLLSLGHCHQGRYVEAIEYANHAVAHCRKAGDQLILAMSLRLLGHTHLKRGDWQSAIESLEESRRVVVTHQVLHDFVTGTFIIAAEAYMEAAARAPERARAYLRQAKSSIRIGNLLSRLFKNWRSHALRVAGRYHIMTGRPARGESLIRASIVISEQLGSSYESGKSYLALAHELRRRHDREADHCLERAREAFAHLGLLPELSEINDVSGAIPGTKDVKPQELELQDQQVLATTREFMSLLHVCQQISGILDLEKLLEYVLEAATEVVGAERGYLLLEKDGRLDVKISKGFDAHEFQSQAFAFSRNMIMEVERNKRPILTTDAQADPRFREHESVQRYGMRSILCVPLIRRDELLGVLYLDNRLLANLFTDRHLELIEAFAGQAAIAIENASFTQTLETRIAERTAELRTANEKLQELDKSKTAFLSNVSHELRTPLTGIKGYLDNMLEGLAGALSDKQAHYARRMKHNVERLARMVNDLLDLSRIESGHLELQLAPVQDSELLREIVESMQPVATNKGIALMAHTSECPAVLRADRDKLHQVVVNLIHNAIKFTPQGGTITVEARLCGQYVQFCVSDTGCGIQPDEASKIFDRFYRGEKSSAEQRGAGLGLAISESLVKLHGGRMWVESIPGKGSQFFFTIPLEPHRL